MMIRATSSISPVARASLAMVFFLPCLGQAAEPQRQFVDGVFKSSAWPTISIRVEEGFEYVGATTYQLEDIAHVDRHHLIAAGPDGQLERMLILHFEGFLPESHEIYRYRIPPADNAAGPDYAFTTEYVRLGDHDYIHNTWFFSARENIRANPEGDLDRTEKLLAAHGYTLPDELRMSRFVRIVGEDARRELIIFYLEPLSPTGLEASQFVAGGAGAAVFDRLSAELTARSRAAFQVVED